ncbi:MAG: lipase [Anaerostipes sp.]|nr:lipase [Anaerostipes sp.]
MKTDKNIVLFGDSLTDYFPMEFFQNVKARVYNRGEAGNTVPEMAARAVMDVVPLCPDVVLMQGGANDYLLPFYRGAETVAEQLLRAADRLRKQLPDTRIYIESLYPMYTKKTGNRIPFWSEGKSNDEIRMINSAVKSLCESSGYFYVDVFAGLAGADGELPLSYTVDGVHLTREGYERVWKVLSQVLIKEGCM